MEIFGFREEEAQPLSGAINASYIPIRIGGRMAATLVRIDRKGDTGRRLVEVDLLVAVVEGSGQVRSGPHVADVSAGDLIVIKANDEHTIWTSSEHMLVTIQRIETEESSL